MALERDLQWPSSGSFCGADASVLIGEASWQVDKVRCATCNAKFSELMKRRHHCRTCGKCVCHECSPNQLQFAGQMQRVCTPCVLSGAGAADLLPALQFLRDQICSLSPSTSAVASLPPASHAGQAVAECMAAVQKLAMENAEWDAQRSRPECFELQEMHPDSLWPETQPDPLLHQESLKEEDTRKEIEPCSMENSQHAHSSLAAEQRELRRSWANMALVRAHVVAMLEKVESGGPQAFRLDGDDSDDCDDSLCSSSSSDLQGRPDYCESTLSSSSARTWVDDDPWDMDWAVLGRADYEVPHDRMPSGTVERVAANLEDSSRSNQAIKETVPACVRVMSVSYPGSCWKTVERKP